MDFGRFRFKNGSNIVSALHDSQTCVMICQPAFAPVTQMYNSSTVQHLTGKVSYLHNEPQRHLRSWRSYSDTLLKPNETTIGMKVKKRGIVVRQTWLLCVSLQEGERELSRGRGIENERGGRTSAVPHASCSMYSAHSSQSGFLQSQSSVPVCRASQQHGASTWPCQVPGPLA